MMHNQARRLFEGSCLTLALALGCTGHETVYEIIGGGGDAGVSLGNGGEHYGVAGAVSGVAGAVSGVAGAVSEGGASSAAGASGLAGSSAGAFDVAGASGAAAFGGVGGGAGADTSVAGLGGMSAAGAAGAGAGGQGGAGMGPGGAAGVGGGAGAGGGAGLGAKCLADGECASNACDASSLACVADQCADHRQDGLETGADCGGGICRACPLGETCVISYDCGSQACNAHTLICVSDSCADLRQDGFETDVDCGGGTCAACPVGGRCQSNFDCPSGHFCNSATSRVCQ
jgi:hypothetical protein